MAEYKNWQLETDEAGIVWLSLDKPKAKLNTLDRSVLNELEQIVEQLDINLPSGIVLRSGKRAGFIAGAEISEFTEVKSVEQAVEFVSYAHKIFNQFEALEAPKVALIHGVCLGGGLELALCCDYLIAEDDASCKLGLPEVKLGIHPGYGGSVRLIERIGVPKAMNLMLAGRVVISRAAKKLGVLDRVQALRYFEVAARDFINRKPEKRTARRLNKALQLPGVRSVLAQYLEKQVSQRANPKHYPAPFALIDLWEDHASDRFEMLGAEIQSISRLINTDTSKNLVRIFFLQEQLKASGKNTKSKKVEHLHVVGAGVMGGDIAAWSALRGIRVTLQDQNPQSIARAMSRAQALFKKKLKLPRLVQAAMDRLSPDLSGQGVATADMIIEAIFEDLKVKREVFAALEKNAPKEAILASNTSSIPIEEIASALKQPERLVGIHFFNPVAKMQLVEVVQGLGTDAKVLAAANAFSLQISRLPVGIKSSPGFLVNRVLMPYLMEAVTMLDEGIDARVLDKAATEFGMPMGPIELADVVGLDICLHVAENLSDEATLPKNLKAKVQKGDVGKKSGQGFYTWRKGKIQKSKAQKSKLKIEADLDSLAKRMIYPMLNECMACLREGVVSSADALDAGVIFGTGFAPFKGGPIQMIRDLGQAEVFTQLKAFHSQYGDRFTPDSGWEDTNIL
ncbi:MAG: 3-hydroxyacyl-CoA dehydrogenase NAD-binding domain-containing protein [Arenicellales bacterium]